jgi:hypothetical protein
MEVTELHQREISALLIPGRGTFVMVTTRHYDEDGRFVNATENMVFTPNVELRNNQLVAATS